MHGQKLTPNTCTTGVSSWVESLRIIYRSLTRGRLGRNGRLKFLYL